jgi:uncharacterized RDD family membrane protein YckC
VEITLNSGQPLTIQTPEQITMELAPAGIGSRFLALALDTLIQGVLYTVIFVIIFLIAGTDSGSGGSSSGSSSDTWGVAIGFFILFCIYWGYFAAFEILWRGQTPGKRVVGIRVVKDTGRPITAIEGIGRNLMRVVDGFFFYLPGLISIVLSREHKRLGDYVAGTIVIHDTKTAEIKPDWSFANPTQAAFRPELSGISEQELVLIETFLHRRIDLDPMVRLKTAISLSEMIQSKTGVAKPANQSDEDFLEATARTVRDQARLAK